MSRWVRAGHLDTGGADELLGVAAGSALTYDHVGSTMEAPLRPGARHFSVELGRGEEVFAAARAALEGFGPQRRLGAQVWPDGACVEQGARVLVELRVGPLSIVVPNEIVRVVDGPDVYGYAYGTLAGHQERGEESFTVHRGPNGTVTAQVVVDATAAAVLVRVAGPGLGVVQAWAARRYLRGLQAACGPGGVVGPGQ